jgi:hypothetical protein
LKSVEVNCQQRLLKGNLQTVVNGTT